MTEKQLPKVRRNKRCYVCNGERPFNPQKGVPYEAYLSDPFCSSVCARAYWDNPIVTGVMGKGDKRRSYLKKDEQASV